MPIKKGGKTGLLEKHLLALVLALIIIGLVLRALPLRYPGLYESDVYFHYLVLRQAVAGNFQVPAINALSNSNGIVFEPKGFYYLTLIPYYLLRDVLSIYQFLRIIPLLYAALQFILFYIFVGKITQNRKFQLLALFLFVFSVANLARTSALTYRGDGFLGVFLLASLILVATVYESDRHIALYSLLSAFLLSICNLIWNGGIIGFAVLSFSLLSMALFGLFKGDDKMLKKTLALAVSLFAYFGLLALYEYAGYLTSQPLLGLPLLCAIVALNLSIISLYLLSKSIPKHKKPIAITAALIIFLLLAVFLWTYTNSSDLYYLFQNGKGSAIAHLVVTELQSPRAGFIVATEGLVSAATPLFYPVLASTFLPLAYKFIPFLILLALLPFYVNTFMEKRTNESKEIKIIALVYFAVAALLVIYAQRFITLLSVPASILEAYTLYWLYCRINVKRAAVVLITCILVLQLFMTVIYVINSAPIDNVNGQFLSAAAWINSNLPRNATLITFWPYGSQIEFYANRTVTEDSVSNQFTSNIYETWLMSANASTAPLKRLNASYLFFSYGMVSESKYLCLEALAYNCTGSYPSSNNTNLYRIANNHAIAGLSLVYANGDTKIFRLS